SCTIQSNQVVAAADMPAIDENLRHCGPPAGAALRILTFGGAMRCVDLLKRHALGGQDVPGPLAKRAPRLSIDFDFGHLRHLCDGMSDHFPGVASAFSPHGCH